MSPALETVLAKAGLQVSPDEFLALVSDAARRLAPPHPEPATYFTPDQQTALKDVGLDLSPAGPADSKPRTRTVVVHAALLLSGPRRHSDVGLPPAPGGPEPHPPPPRCGCVGRLEGQGQLAPARVAVRG